MGFFDKVEAVTYTSAVYIHLPIQAPTLLLSNIQSRLSTANRSRVSIRGRLSKYFPHI